MVSGMIDLPVNLYEFIATVLIHHNSENAIEHIDNGGLQCSVKNNDFVTVVVNRQIMVVLDDVTTVQIVKGRQQLLWRYLKTTAAYDGAAHTFLVLATQSKVNLRDFAGKQKNKSSLRKTFSVRSVYKMPELPHTP